METVVNKKQSVEELTRNVSNPYKPSCFKGSLNSEDEVSLGVDWEGELINALDDLKKSRK